MLEYEPEAVELERLRQRKLPPKVRDVLFGTPLNLTEPVPIKTENQAREYINLKMEKYGYQGKLEVAIDKYIANAMNDLLASGFTYFNLYARTHTFLREPHIAAALAFNTFNDLSNIPDEIDRKFGLTYK